MKTLYDLNFEQLKEYCLEKGWKAFRGRQIFQWVYRDRVLDFNDMNNLSLETRETLSKDFVLSNIKLVTKQLSKDGTTKYLFELEDGNLVESVLMVYSYGKSICVSSQVGCNMGCTFCASGLLKKKRNLTSGEMVAQIIYVQKDLDLTDDRLSHIVVMGTGEPFDNYNNVMNFLNTVNHDCGLGIGARHITVSTCGLVNKIREFADEHVQYNLAISLHAPNDELRNKLLPINKVYNIEKLMDSIDYYFINNNRKVTFEYILLKDVNDKEEHAKQLAKLLKWKNAYVNLIPYNSVDEHGFKGTTYKESMKFYDMLMKLNVRCTIRKEHGADIDAACGQLRAKEIKKRG